MGPPGELEKIISPVNLLSFQEEYFEKKPLLITRKDSEYFHYLLSIGEINTYLERKDIRYPAIRLVKNGLELPQASYLKSYRFGSQVFDRVVDNDRLFTAFAEGATIVFQALHRTLPSLSFLCQHLEKNFSFPLQANIYLTPASSKGFEPHYDNHDVFVLQTYGAKRWRVYDSPVLLPSRPFDKKKWKPTGPQIEVELKAGDTLYIPRGFVHEAQTAEDTSMHITLGLLSYTWIDVFRLLLDKTKDLEDFRRSFDWKNFPEDKLIKRLTELAGQLIDHIQPEDIPKEFAFRFSKKSMSADQNRLLDLIRKDKISTNTKFKIRKEINFFVEKTPTTVALVFYHKKMLFPDYVLKTLESIIAKAVFFISDLESDLDEEGKWVLCKKLLSEGFLTLNDHA